MRFWQGYLGCKFHERKLRKRSEVLTRDVGCKFDERKLCADFLVLLASVEHTYDCLLVGNVADVLLGEGTAAEHSNMVDVAMETITSTATSNHQRVMASA